VIAPSSVPRPPLPRADAIVDPRVGDAGPALLALEDGTVFAGIAFGAPVASGGDLVVNTSQTGYQEIATDPSYAGQVVVMTYPLIGNYGRLHADDQSERPWLRGLVVAHATAAVLDDARQLATLLRANGIPAIAGIDTRALARHLRANGCLRGIVTERNPANMKADAKIYFLLERSSIATTKTTNIPSYLTAVIKNADTRSKAFSFVPESKLSRASKRADMVMTAKVNMAWRTCSMPVNVRAINGVERTTTRSIKKRIKGLMPFFNRYISAIIMAMKEQTAVIIKGSRSLTPKM
jgi:hypothetical protein